jgi:DHA2 family multidrug resistance protein
MMFRQRVEAMANMLTHVGGRAPSMAQARLMAQGSLYGQLVTQSTILAYLDVISVLAAGSVCMIPLVFFMKKHKPGAAGMGMH